MTGHSASCDCDDCDWGTDTPLDVRWQCVECGRFISNDKVRSEDYLDNGAYYGVSTRTEYDCKKCGLIKDEPRLIVFAAG